MVVEPSYTGIVPDTFKDEAEVVLKGRLDADGVPHRPERRDGKCPSKYEAAEAGVPLDRTGVVMASLGSFLLLATFVVCAMPR